eukprot:m.1316848 g.1316848  ORF g.1316848 m.1316848 type:complete len:1510 (-) comp24839_c1_seq2:107-4636(-)
MAGLWEVNLGNSKRGVDKWKRLADGAADRVERAFSSYADTAGFRNGAFDYKVIFDRIGGAHVQENTVSKMRRRLRRLQGLPQTVRLEDVKGKTCKLRIGNVSVEQRNQSADSVLNSDSSSISHAKDSSRHGRKRYNWQIYIRQDGASPDPIQSVEFVLPIYFKHRRVRKTFPETFEMSCRQFTEFELEMFITLKSNRTIQFFHDLSFDFPIKESVYIVDLGDLSTVAIQDADSIDSNKTIHNAPTFESIVSRLVPSLIVRSSTSLGTADSSSEPSTPGTHCAGRNSPSPPPVPASSLTASGNTAGHVQYSEQPDTRSTGNVRVEGMAVREAHTQSPSRPCNFGQQGTSRVLSPPPFPRASRQPRPEPLLSSHAPLTPDSVGVSTRRLSDDGQLYNSDAFVLPWADVERGDAQRCPGGRIDIPTRRYGTLSALAYGSPTDAPRGVALCLHGVPSNAESSFGDWLLPALVCAGYYAVALDMPGCGASPGPVLKSRSEYCLDDNGACDIVHDVINHLLSVSDGDPPAPPAAPSDAHTHSDTEPHSQGAANADAPHATHPNTHPNTHPEGDTAPVFDPHVSGGFRGRALSTSSLRYRQHLEQQNRATPPPLHTSGRSTSTSPPHPPTGNNTDTSGGRIPPGEARRRQQVSLIGYDWGGGIALSMARSQAHNKRIAQVVLFHPSYTCGDNPETDLAAVACPVHLMWCRQDMTHHLRAWKPYRDALRQSLHDLYTEYIYSEGHYRIGVDTRNVPMLEAQVLKALLGEDAAVQVMLGADPPHPPGMTSSVTSSPGSVTRVVNYPRTKTISSSALEARLPQQHVGVAKRDDVTRGTTGAIGKGAAPESDDAALHATHVSPQQSADVSRGTTACQPAPDRMRGVDSGIVALHHHEPTADSAVDDASDALQPTNITCKHIPEAAITLGECLGSGAFGIVYRARVDPAAVAAMGVGTSGASVGSKGGAGDSGMASIQAHTADWAGLPVDVAVKKLHSGGTNARHIEQLRNEAMLVASVPVHVNVARLLAVCMDTMSPALVLELYDGGDVHTAMYGDGRGKSSQLSRVSHPGTIASWCQQICAGMAHLHKCGIYHRDLKPKNILIKKEPSGETAPPLPTQPPALIPSRLVISDFGVSKQVPTNTTEVSQMHTMAGTVVYMAPEILRGDSSSKGSDVWSYGVIVWELLVGMIPYSYWGPIHPGAVLLKVGGGEKLWMPPPEESWPAPFDNLIAACLTDYHRSRIRFASALDVLAEGAQAFASMSEEAFLAQRRQWQASCRRESPATAADSVSAGSTVNDDPHSGGDGGDGGETSVFGTERVANSANTSERTNVDGLESTASSSTGVGSVGSSVGSDSVGSVSVRHSEADDTLAFTMHRRLSGDSVASAAASPMSPSIASIGSPMSPFLSGLTAGSPLPFPDDVPGSASRVRRLSSTSSTLLDFSNKELTTETCPAQAFLTHVLPRVSHETIHTYERMCAECGFDFAKDFDLYEEEELVEMGFKKVHARKIKRAREQMLALHS